MSLNGFILIRFSLPMFKVVEVFGDSHKNLRGGRKPPLAFQRGGEGEKKEKFSSVQKSQEGKKEKEQTYRG